jgi:hypothetical protein
MAPERGDVAPFDDPPAPAFAAITKIMRNKAPTPIATQVVVE